MKTFKIALLVLIAPIYSHAASTPEDCTAITNDTYRLKCYDKFFAENKYVHTEEKVSFDDSNTSKKKAESDVFGLENRTKDKVKSIHSQAIGTFSKWKKGMSIELENGQEWKVIDTQSLYHPATNPKVTIERAFLGSFFMSFEDLNKRLKVKRVK